MQDISSVELTQSGPGVIIPVKAVAGASRDRIAGVLGGRVKITVSAAAEKGKANKAIAKVLAAALGVAPRDVQLVNGMTSVQKEFAAAGLTVSQVRQRLAGAKGGRKA